MLATLKVYRFLRATEAIDALALLRSKGELLKIFEEKHSVFYIEEEVVKWYPNPFLRQKTISQYCENQYCLNITYLIIQRNVSHNSCYILVY